MILGVTHLVLCNFPSFFCEICENRLKNTLFPLDFLHSAREHYMIMDRLSKVSGNRRHDTLRRNFCAVAYR